MVNLCQLEELKLSCFGCCGREHGTKKEVGEALVKNTFSYDNAKDKKEWGKRMEGYIRECGICYNLIKRGNEVFCPLHPYRNYGKDIRDNVCEKDYRCKAVFLFEEKWDDETRKKFIGFIKSKHLDWYSYSIKMDNNSLVEEFESR